MVELSFGGSSSPSVAEQIALVMGALSPVAVLLGVWLGKRWDQGGAKSAWLRERRLEICTRIVTSVEESGDLQVQAVAALDDDTRLALCDQMRVVQAMHSKLLAEAMLLGPPAVVTAAHKLMDADGGLFLAVVEACRNAPEGEHAEWPEDLHGCVASASAEFVTHAADAMR